MSRSAADLRNEIERQYRRMRQERIDYELHLFHQIDEALLEQLASLFKPDYLVRWLCSPHEALWWCRPIEYIESNPSTFANELLQIARSDARASFI